MGDIGTQKQNRDAGTKKFVVARFLDYKMVDSKNVISQHKRKEMMLKNLSCTSSIEEDNKLAQKDTYTPDSAKANMVEHAVRLKVLIPGNKKDKKKMTRTGKGSS
ncbi:hypothetical protein Tco_0186474 [Tanacetum coccineum]